MRIAIIGPEASGKTELAQSLALHFHGTATEEYARRYFAEHALPADYVLQRHEMLEVMTHQHAAEQGEGLRFIDASCIHGPLYAAMTRDAQDNLALIFPPSALKSWIMRCRAVMMPSFSAARIGIWRGQMMVCAPCPTLPSAMHSPMPALHLSGSTMRINRV